MVSLIFDIFPPKADQLYRKSMGIDSFRITPSTFKIPILSIIVSIAIL